MKSRHAAMLALVGWYLIAPWAHLENSYYEKAMGPSLAEPSAWATLDTFDTFSECRRALALRQGQASKQAQQAKPGARYPQGPYDMRNATCIASDDPRFANRTLSR